METEERELTYDESVTVLNDVLYNLLDKYDEEELSVPEKYDAILREMFKLDVSPYSQEPRLLDTSAQHTAIHRVISPMAEHLATLPAFLPEEERTFAYQWTLDSLEEIFEYEQDRFRRENPEAEPDRAFIHAQESLLRHRIDPRFRHGESFDRDAAYDFYLYKYLQFREERQRAQAAGDEDAKFKAEKKKRYL